MSEYYPTIENGKLEFVKFYGEYDGRTDINGFTVYDVGEWFVIPVDEQGEILFKDKSYDKIEIFTKELFHTEYPKWEQKAYLLENIAYRVTDIDDKELNEYVATRMAMYRARMKEIADGIKEKIK